jgi:hypothetical protein
MKHRTRHDADEEQHYLVFVGGNEVNPLPVTCDFSDVRNRATASGTNSALILDLL